MPEPVDQDHLRSLLDGLEARWRRLGAPIAESLAPGLPDSAFERKTTGLPFDIPTELRVWWSWHNGLTSEAAPWVGLIGPSYGLLSLEGAIKWYRLNREWAPYDELDDVPEMYWHEDWLPFLIQDSQRLYVTCRESALGEVSPIRLVSYEWEDFQSVRAPSLAAAVDRWLLAFDAGFYRWSSTANGWECDFAEMPLDWRTSGLF